MSRPSGNDPGAGVIESWKMPGVPAAERKQDAGGDIYPDLPGNRSRVLAARRAEQQRKITALLEGALFNYKLTDSQRTAVEKALAAVKEGRLEDGQAILEESLPSTRKRR